jgi:hypothetical protein
MRQSTIERYNTLDRTICIGNWTITGGAGAVNDTIEITITPGGYYLTTKIQLDNSGGQVLLYHDSDEVDRSIEYMHSTEGLSWQPRIRLPLGCQW